MVPQCFLKSFYEVKVSWETAMLWKQTSWMKTNLLFSYDVSTAIVSDARPLVGNDLGSDVEGVGEAPVEPRASPRLGKNTRLCQKRNQLAQPPTGSCLVALTCQVDQSQKEA